MEQEERAKQVIVDYEDAIDGYLSANTDVLVGIIAAAVRAAVDAQKERDAQIAEGYLAKPYADGRWIEGGELAAVVHIAAAIRAQDSLRANASDNSPAGT